LIALLRPQPGHFTPFGCFADLSFLTGMVANTGRLASLTSKLIDAAARFVY
jgi:hypothetical protein